MFKISSKGTFKVIYAFEGGADGANPIGNLARDKSGNLYGAAELGGAYGFGTVFKIAP